MKPARPAQRYRLFGVSMAFVIGIGSTTSWAANAPAFPQSRPRGGSFSRPADGEVLQVTPPGFSWWRAARAGKVSYRLKVLSDTGAEVYPSSRLEDPVCVPERALPAGKYSWTVEALGTGDDVLCVRSPRSFEIAPGAVSQPWVKPEKLLERVPKQHPRLLFPQAQLAEIRSTLKTSRREAFDSLRKQATRGLKMSPPPDARLRHSAYRRQ